ncbi:MAG: hypothetical protein KJ072_28180 [Verrucomicrobia bacterium]|nr:hypothetical protein [Verrucomicrobiota bacterium]
MKTTTPRRDARIRIALYCLLMSAAIVLPSVSTEQKHWAGALFLAASYTLGPALPRSQAGPKRTGWRGCLLSFLRVIYLALLGYGFVVHGLLNEDPMPPALAAILLVLNSAFCARQWIRIRKADDPTLAQAFADENWPGV